LPNGDPVFLFSNVDHPVDDMTVGSVGVHDRYRFRIPWSMSIQIVVSALPLNLIIYVLYIYKYILHS
jgi:hypothetical protein